MPTVDATAASTVDFPVPGGPSSSTWRPAASAAITTSTSRRRPTTSGTTRSGSNAGRAGLGTGSALAGPAASVVDDDAPDVLAVAHVLVPLVDLIEGVGAGHELVEHHLSLTVQAEDLRDVRPGVGRAEDGAPDLFLHHGQVEQVELDLVLVPRGHGGHHQPAGLGHKGHGGGDEVPLRHAGGEDHLVGHGAPRQLPHELEGRLDTGGGVGGAEELCLLALELD